MSNFRANSHIFNKERPFRVIVCFITLWSFLFNIFVYDIARAAGRSLELTEVGSERAGSSGSSLAIDTPLDGKKLDKKGSDEEFRQRVGEVREAMEGLPQEPSSETIVRRQRQQLPLKKAALRRGKVTYGYFLPETREITIYIERAKEAFETVFEDIAEKFAITKGKELKDLDDEEKKELRSRFTGFVHCHEIFHQLVALAGISYANEEEECALADIFATQAMGLEVAETDKARLDAFAEEVDDKHIRTQLTLLYFTTQPTEQGETDFWMNLRRLGVNIYNIRTNIRAEAIEDIPPGARAMSRERVSEEFEKGAEVLGGKGSWSNITETLAEEIGFKTPSSTYIAIQEVWGGFIEANRDLVVQGNKLIQDDTANNGEVSGEILTHLRKIIQRFTLPEELADGLIKPRTSQLKGWIIDRSSGRREDSFIRNLAGIFISPKRRDERLVVQGIKDIFDQAMGVIWLRTARDIYGNYRPVPRQEGIPNVLSAEEGFGVLVQPFLSFDASGTAMSNLYGHTAIEAVCGDADMAVRPVHANVTQFLFEKGQDSSSAVFEYNPTFLRTPYDMRLKGKEYCAATNLQEMEEVMTGFPKINGIFSPVDEAQAKELNRVVNALEDKIGAPLDIEWGFLDGELYIIQIRPIIGDFRKPLVEASAELREKASIAQTPISLGHTSQDGFTGRTVLFGDNVSRDTVKQFEEELGENYIRVQTDVASAVLGKETRAKVLVDPDQGSRQAHNINLVTGRIGSGEFAYCNGPILKDGLLNNLHFMPHPELEGVWISGEEVTYFSDGLRGRFYSLRERVATAGHVPADDARIQMMDVLRREILDLPEEPVDEMERIEKIISRLNLGLFYDYWKTQYFYWNEERERERDSRNFIHTFEDSLTHKQKEEHIERLERLKAILELPLWPEEWNLRWLGLLRRITKFIDDYKSHNEKRESRRAMPRNDNFRAVIFDCHGNNFGVVENNLSSWEHCAVTRVPGDFWDSFTGILSDYEDDVDFVLIHMGGRDYEARVIEVVERIKQRNPEALVMVESRWETSSDEEIVKMVEERYCRWEDKHKQEIEEQRRQAQQKPKPKRPEKLRVLFVNDFYAERDVMETLAGHRLGLEKLGPGHYADGEYDLKIVRNQQDAIDVLSREEVHYVIVDWLLPTGVAVANNPVEPGLGPQAPVLLLRKIRELNIQRLGIHTALEDYYSEALDYFEESSIDVQRYPMEGESRIRCIKEARQQQLESYEKELTEWQAAQPQLPGKPEYPEKLRVLIIEDDESLAERYRTDMPRHAGDEYEFIVVNNMQQARVEVGDNKIDYCLADWEGTDVKKAESLATLKDMFKGAVFGMCVISGYVTMSNIDSFKEHLVEAGFARDAPLNVIDFIYSYDQFTQMLKEARQQQIEAYEKTFAEWEATQEAGPVVAARPPKFNVLVLEDDQGVLSGFESYFGGAFDPEYYEVFYAKTYTDGLAISEEHRVDAVVLDLGMSADHSSGTFDKHLDNIPSVSVISGFTVAPDRYESVVESRWGQAIAERACIVDKGPDTMEVLVPEIKRAREEQLRAWEAAQPRKPERPEKLRMLIIHDDDLFREQFELGLSSNLGTEEYEYISASNMENALKVVGEQKIDICFADWAGTDVSDRGSLSKLRAMFRDTIYGMHILTAYVDNIDVEKNILDCISRAGFTQNDTISIVDPMGSIGTCTQIVKEARQRQLEAYDQALAQWQATQAEAQERPAEPQKETIFIVNNSSQEAKFLAEFITEEFGDRYDVVPVTVLADSLYMLERELRDKTPNIVITDMLISRKEGGEVDKLDDIIQCVREKNPKTRFIITSEEAAITPVERFTGKDVIGLVEKPFYSAKVIELLKGLDGGSEEPPPQGPGGMPTSGTSPESDSGATRPPDGESPRGPTAQNAEERLERINHIHARIKEDAGIADKTCKIMIADDYVGYRQKNLRMQIARKTEHMRYKVEFGTVDELVEEACKQENLDSEAVRAVAILPLDKLNEEQVAQLAANNVRVIYINLDRPYLGAYDSVPIEGLIAAGKAYLNSDEESFYRLYELLTLIPSADYTPLLLEQLREDPTLFINALHFILKPITAENPDQLDQINDRMELLLMAV
ncbi:MAG: hypothetical protein NG740_02435 [Omnitrophica bacterium]|nr:hypothetical protein [Candidatus Omnitrophota bacterium]